MTEEFIAGCRTHKNIQFWVHERRVMAANMWCVLNARNVSGVIVKVSINGLKMCKCIREIMGAKEKVEIISQGHG